MNSENKNYPCGYSSLIFPMETEPEFLMWSYAGAETFSHAMVCDDEGLCPKTQAQIDAIHGLGCRWSIATMCKWSGMPGELVNKVGGEDSHVTNWDHLRQISPQFLAATNAAEEFTNHLVANNDLGAAMESAHDWWHIIPRFHQEVLIATTLLISMARMSHILRQHDRGYLIEMVQASNTMSQIEGPADIPGFS